MTVALEELSFVREIMSNYMSDQERTQGQETKAQH